MKRLITLALALALTFSIAVGVSGAASPGTASTAGRNDTLGAIDTEGMMNTLTWISTTPRSWTEDEIIPIREYIQETLTEYGYTVTDKTFETEGYEYELLVDEITEPGFQVTNPDAYVTVNEVLYTGHNIEAVKEAAGDSPSILVVGAHYDTASGAPGANDNGSGLVVLLEVARLVKDLPSEIEVRFVCFDAEEAGMLGSHNYVRGLTDEELSRVIGMVNFDMLGAYEADEILAATPNGESNYLSEMFDAFPLDKSYASDHFSFHGKVIPTVNICHAEVGPYHTPEDTAEKIDPAKLTEAAYQGAEVIAKLIGGAELPVVPSAVQEEAYILEEDVSFDLYLDREYVEESLGVTGTQVPAYPSVGNDFDTSYTATVELWGVECEMRFDYVNNDGVLVGISGSVTDAAALAAALDERFQSLSLTENIDIAAPLTESSRVWVSDEGSAFVLNEDEEDTLYISGYAIYEEAELQDGEIVAELDDAAAEAWARVSELIARTDIADKIISVTFLVDGFGADDFYMESDFLSGEISLVLDPNELIDERGTLYTDESLTHAFIAGYAEYLFNSSSQIDYETLANEEGVPYGYLNRGYKADSYLAMYMDEFGLEVDPEAGYYDEYWQQQDIVAEMSGNLAVYITGASGDGQDTAKLDFFAAFPVFQAMKTFEGGL